MGINMENMYLFVYADGRCHQIENVLDIEVAECLSKNSTLRIFKFSKKLGFQELSAIDGSGNVIFELVDY